MIAKLLVLSTILGGWSDGYTWRVSIKHHESGEVQIFELTKGSRRVPLGDHRWCEIKLDLPDFPDLIGAAAQSAFISCEREASTPLRAWADRHVSDLKEKKRLLDAAGFKVGTGGFCAFDQREKVLGLHVYFGDGQTYQVKVQCL